MKICHIITRMIVGGAQENTLLTIKGHLEHGHEVVLATGLSPGREGELLDKTAIPGLRVVVFPDLVRNLSLGHDMAAFWRLKNFLHSEHFDVVHTHSSKAGIIGRLAARSAGVPVVVHTVHGQAFHPYQAAWRNALYIALERLAASRSDRIFAVAQAMIDQCVAARVAPAELYRVVYSGMEMERFTTVRRSAGLRERLGIPAAARVIVTVARLFPQKGYEFVFPALRKVVDKYPETMLLVVGDGPEYDRYRAEIARLGLTANVRFAGLVAPTEVPDYLAQGDLLWHLSLHEGLPRAVVQALAVGIPAIGFALDGTPEVIVGGETGFVVPPEDFDAVAGRTAELWNNAELRRKLGDAGRCRVQNQFDWHRMCDTLEKEYAELLEAKKNHVQP